MIGLSVRHPQLPFLIRARKHGAAARLILLPVFVWLVAGWVCPRLMAATPVLLMDQRMEPHAVQLHAIRGDEIQHYSQRDRALVSESLSGYLRVTIANEAAPVMFSDEGDAFAQAWIVLSDGQRLSGGFIGGSNDGERLLWRHGLLGEVELALERVRMIDLGKRPTTVMDQMRDGGDVVLLANGDVLTGFVEAITGETLELQLDDDAGTTVRLTMDRVSAVRLGNPDQAMTTGATGATGAAGRSGERAGQAGHRVTLADGSQLMVNDFSVAGDELVFEAKLVTSEHPMRIALENVRQVDLSYGGRRLESLSHLPMTVADSPAVFTVAMPPYVKADRVHLHAPAVVRFHLPDGAVRWAGRVGLDGLERYGQAGAWADCELVIRGDDRVLGRYRLNATQPVVWVNTPLKALDLVLELHEGVNGPVMDRVVIEGAAVLIDRPGG